MRRPGLLGLLLTVALLGTVTTTATAGDLTLPADPATATAPVAPLPDWLTYQDPYKAAAADPRQAHMANADISLWAQERVTDALTLPHQGLEEKVAALRTTFTDKGWSEYGQVLSAGDRITAVRQGQDLATVANGEAQVIANGENNGHYRWRLSIPVMQAYGRGTGGTTQQTAGQMHTLIVDIMRVSSTDSAAAGSDLRIDGMRLAEAATAP